MKCHKKEKVNEYCKVLTVVTKKIMVRRMGVFYLLYRFLYFYFESQSCLSADLAYLGTHSAIVHSTQACFCWPLLHFSLTLSAAESAVTEGAVCIPSSGYGL